MRVSLLLCVAVAIGSGCLGREEKSVSVRAPGIVRVGPGGSAQVPVRVRVASGRHVQANPASRGTLVPLTLEVEASEGVRMESARYPEALERTRGRLRVYTGDFEVQAVIAADAGSRPGRRVKLLARIRYQACDDAGTCRYPATEAFAIEVEVGSASLSK